MRSYVKNLTLSAMFIAIGFVLPFLTGHIPQIGSMLSPMHIPVFLCGLICGWPYGAVVGFLLPLSRSLILGMPPLYPTALAMSFELLTYGLASGLIYRLLHRRGMLAVYIALVGAMLAGRAIWGVAQVILLGLGGNSRIGTGLDSHDGVVVEFQLDPVVDERTSPPRQRAAGPIGSAGFMAGAFVNAVPGIILHLILVPAIMFALDRTKLVKFEKTPTAA